MLPVSDFLYLGCALWLAGIAGLVLRPTARGGPVAVAVIISGLVLLALAFSRYWGNVDGQALAALLSLVLVGYAVVGMRVGAADTGGGSERLVRKHVAAAMAWVLLGACLLLGSLFLDTRVTSLGPTRVHDFGGLRPRLSPVSAELVEDEVESAKRSAPGGL